MGSRGAGWLSESASLTKLHASLSSRACCAAQWRGSNLAEAALGKARALMSRTPKATEGTKPGPGAAKSAARPRDPVWLIRTYSGHSSAKASNELYRTNLARGQTGLSVAFDLPTQTGYDSDHAEA